MRSALVLGVNGQDGSYLAERLLERDYAVIGIGRQPQSRYVRPGAGFRYVSLDLQDVAAFERFLITVDPDLAFHVAAIHGASGFQYEPVWQQMMAVNVLSLHALLEHARLRRPDLRIAYASSAKVFPGPLKGTIDETTPMAATCLYSIGKLAGLNLIRQYRERHDIAASNLFLFNHESPRRGGEYFVPTIVRCLAGALRVPGDKTTLQSLSFRADWSAAAELMDIAIDLAEQAPGRDFVLASGTTWHARNAIEELFRRHGLDYRNHIVESDAGRDPGPEFNVSLARLKSAINREPERDFFEIANDMLAELERPVVDMNRSASSGTFG